MKMFAPIELPTSAVASASRRRRRVPLGAVLPRSGCALPSARSATRGPGWRVKSPVRIVGGIDHAACHPASRPTPHLAWRLTTRSQPIRVALARRKPYGGISSAASPVRHAQKTGPPFWARPVTSLMLVALPSRCAAMPSNGTDGNDAGAAHAGDEHAILAVDGRQGGLGKRRHEAGRPQYLSAPSACRLRRSRSWDRNPSGRKVLVAATTGRWCACGPIRCRAATTDTQLTPRRSRRSPRRPAR